MNLLITALRKAETALTDVIADSVHAGFIRGAADVLGDIPSSAMPTAPPAVPPISPPPLATRFPEGDPFVRFPVSEAAAERVAKARIISPGEFGNLSGPAKEQAFTITTGMAEESIEKIKEVLAENIRSGADRVAFVKDVEDLFEEGIPLSRAHIDQIFRNNVGAAYSDGQEKALRNEFVVDAFPYRHYFATTDQRVRPEHFALETLGLNGTSIYNMNDPVWNLFRPPWSWNCRCAWSGVTVEQAADEGVKEAKDWMQRAKQYAKDNESDPALAIAPTKPLEFQMVKMPVFASDPKVLDPSWRRDVTI